MKKLGLGLIVETKAVSTAIVTLILSTLLTKTLVLGNDGVEVNRPRG